MKKIIVVIVALVVNLSNAGILNWETNKAAAFAQALQENKLVLMLRGNPGCQYCIDAKNNTCETTVPNIVGLIQENYVTWFAQANKDEGNEYTDWWPHEGYYSLAQAYPVFACIDPHFTNECFDLSTGDLRFGKELTTTSFYARLSSHIIPKSKEKAKLKILWNKTDKDKFSLKLKFMSDEKPFNTDSEVEVYLGQDDIEVIPAKKANVKGNHLKVSNQNAKLQLQWNKKKNICSLNFKINKTKLSDVFQYMVGEARYMGYRTARVKIKIDKTLYYFYPKLKYDSSWILTTGIMQRKKTVF